MSNARKAQLKLMMQQEREKEAMEAARQQAEAKAQADEEEWRQEELRLQKEEEARREAREIAEEEEEHVFAPEHSKLHLRSTAVKISRLGQLPLSHPPASDSPCYTYCVL